MAKAIGRIAAFVQSKMKEKQQLATGLSIEWALMHQKSSFFACFLILEKPGWKRRNEAIGWGPITLVKRINGWGLLAWMASQSRNYNIAWNFGYYQKLFEDYGFQIYQTVYLRPKCARM